MLKKIIAILIISMLFIGCEGGGSGATGAGGSDGICNNEYAGQWGMVYNNMYSNGEDCNGGFSMSSALDPWIVSDANQFINLKTDCSFTLSDVNCDNYYDAAQTSPDEEVVAFGISMGTNASIYQTACTGSWSASGTTISLVQSAYGQSEISEYTYNGFDEIGIDEQMDMGNGMMCHHYEYAKMDGAVCLFDCPNMDDYVDVDAQNNQHDWCAYVNALSEDCYSDCGATITEQIELVAGGCDVCPNAADESSWHYSGDDVVCVYSETCQTCLDDCTSIALASDTPPPNQEQAIIWCLSDSGSSISCYEDCQGVEDHESQGNDDDDEMPECLMDCAGINTMGEDAGLDDLCGWLENVDQACFNDCDFGASDIFGGECECWQLSQEECSATSGCAWYEDSEGSFDCHLEDE